MIYKDIKGIEPTRYLLFSSLKDKEVRLGIDNLLYACNDLEPIRMLLKDELIINDNFVDFQLLDLRRNIVYREESASDMLKSISGVKYKELYKYLGENNSFYL